MINMEGSSLLDSATAQQVALDCMRKQAERVMRASQEEALLSGFCINSCLRVLALLESLL